MLRRLLPVMLAAVTLLAAWSLDPGGTRQARAQGPRRTAPNLFYNYYVPPVGCGGVGAQLYLSPRPTPPLVGHTYVTYQPLMPHEFLYEHQRKYLRRNPGSGWTVTSVEWRHDWLDFNCLRRPPKVVFQRPLCGKCDLHPIHR